MCGIAGWVDWEGRPDPGNRALAEMSAVLADRGPDAEGTWLGGPAHLAHRRLIVVDPAGGLQPMVRRDGRGSFVITYNGELYNAPELRSELTARGHVFESRSDTEVLLRSYMEWGAASLERLNGIFAYGVWDEGRQELFLARDRMGVKPLFYAERGGRLLFGSELKAILAHPAVDAAVDAEGLAEVFAIGPARTPGHGVFRGIRELRPGHYLRYDRRGLHLYQYWRLESHEHPDDVPTTARRVRELLGDAVSRQLVSDVPLATLLSGGLDSSAVTALASPAWRAEGRGDLHTYSIDFVDMERYFRPTRFQTNLDTPWVHRVSSYLTTTHRQVTLDTPELAEALPVALRARDLPGMADVDISLYLFAREIKREVTVALSGEAADEVFGGYPWLFHEEALAADTFPWSRRLKDRIQILSPELIDRLQPEAYVERRYREALEEVPRLPGEAPGAARRREILYLNISRFLPTLLDRKDRMSMAVGLEVRVPFCDHRLVEYVWNIPWEQKVYGGQPKGILRLALQEDLPDDVRNRPKSPYPSTPNPTFLEAMRTEALRRLSDTSSPLRPLLDLEAIWRLARTGDDQPDLPWFGQLMQLPQLFAYLIQADLWLREYKIALV